MRGIMRGKLFKNLFSTTLLFSLSACISIPNTTAVTAPSKLSDGGLWGQTNVSNNGELTFAEMMDFIEPQSARTCVPVGIWITPDGNYRDTAWHSGDGFIQILPVCSHDQTHGPVVKLPARAGAIMISEDDYNKNKTAIEQMCRSIGKDCTYEAPTIPPVRALSPKGP